ncbi:MAG TPA: Smr/MutS family protein [Polyangia bacterium]|nr:Smr/MutS family protein [Polyangia bacterium]
MTDSRFLEVLDWGELLARLAAEAHSARGRALCLELALAADAAAATRRTAAVAELAALVRGGEALPSLAAPEIEPALGAAEKEIVLGADELRPVAVLTEIGEAARRAFLAPRGGRPPLGEVAALAERLDPPRGLARTIGATFDASGEISDAASPELARLREERKSLSEGARGAVERIMKSEEYASVLQDQFFTVRADRYVLPLKASAKSLGLGIVHDTSRTGETVFVEPTALVAANNRLKVVELEIRRESRRILEALTADVATLAPALRQTAAALAELDALAAAARLGVAYGGAAIELVDQPVVALTAARHPLLALAHAAAGHAGDVVANDVALGGDAARILIVSGPNAGGKTVLMKTVGLAALMARAGLLVAAAPGSRIGFFDAVRADIGDRQSVLGDLSTFSGHLANVAEILNASPSSPSAGPALVLLDELMAGTNPDQGAALARATAETLAERPVLSVITTHYDSLKALGESDARFANAGMEYDLERLRPTFRLAIGAPGRAYAFDIAARMGLPAPLLERARTLAGDSSVGLESAIARLEEREAAALREAERLAAAEAAAAATAEAQRAAAEALARRERELGHKAREAVEAAIAEAREEIRGVVRRAQEAGTGRAAEAAREELGRVGEAALAKLPRPEARAIVEPPPLQVGARVRVERLGADGVVAQLPDARGRAKVTVGKMTVEVGVDELRPVGAPNRQAVRAAAATAARAEAQPEEALALVSQASTPTVDLRGQTGDDALAAVEGALDRAALSGQSHVIVVHGHGTGALRKRVRAYLDDSPYVARWAPGTSRQGGDGVSVVELR